MTSEIEFKAWPKTPRLNRGCVVTEKIDGTNAAVIVTDSLEVGAQSRNRLITPDDDNAGFAAWVKENAEPLASILGPGRHFGEWWGQGIQRKYGLDHKRFSLFNVNRYGATDFTEVPALGVVPTLWTGPFSTDAVAGVVETLRQQGSQAAPGFMRPEGVIVFHVAAQCVFKVTLEGDNPRCVNPFHLRIGTQADNLADMAAKGRRLQTHCRKGHEFTPENTYKQEREGRWYGPGAERAGTPT